MFEANIPESLTGNCEKFYVQGKSITNELSFKDRLLLKIGAIFTKDPKEKATMLTEFNALDINNLKAIIKAIELLKN